MTSSATSLQSLGLLAIRVVLGIVFVGHGADKLGDLSGTEQMFNGLGIPAPALMAPLVAFTEVIGGALLIVGLLTPLAGAALAIDMLVAFLTVHAGKGFFVADGGYELVMLLGFASIGVAATGAGRLSLDAVLKLPERVTGGVRTGSAAPTT
jgi:putative oxidoreductase